jgi:5-methylthioadenosine/S-adenosylhomocysteine deaminase
MACASLVIHNGTILTMDSSASVIERGYVLIRDGAIAAVASGDPPPLKDGAAIDAERGVIMPGLVNGHTHAAMTLFRGLADDLPLMQWLERYIFPVERRMDAAFVRAGAMLACAEMIRSGTTTFCDMYLFEQEVAAAARQAGMRCLVGEVLYDFPSPNYGPLERGFAYTEALIDRWAGDDLVSVAVEAHAPYTCSPELLQRASRLAQQRGVPLILHLAETESETLQIQQRYGLRPVEHLERLGVLGPHLIADHCVHLNAAEMDLLAARGVRCIHCPESNMKLASGIAPVPALISRGVAVGLGTDGCASNNDLDLFGEMDTAAKLHKLQQRDPTAMDAVTVLALATREGARALGIGALAGSLEAGKRADLIVLDTRQPHLVPLYHPISHVVYAARGGDVRHVVIDGQVVLRDRRFTTLDLHAVLSAAEEMAGRVRRWVAEG